MSVITAPATRPVPQVTTHEVPTPRRTHRWVDWVVTTDHKKIGIMYLVTTFVFFFLGGIEALLMRVQLSEPNNTLLSGERFNELLTLHGTTMVFLFVVPVMAGLRQLLRAADDRGARHGVPAPQRALLLVAPDRRDRVLRHALLPPARGRLVELPAAVGDPVLAQRRPGRLDLPHPPHRHLLAARRDQLLRHDRQHARARDELGTRTPVHLGDPRLRGAADHRAARGGRRGHDAPDRPPLRHPLVRPDRARLADPLAAPVLVLRAPRGLHHGPARLRDHLRGHPGVLAASRSSATRRSPRPPP